MDKTPKMIWCSMVPFFRFRIRKRFLDMTKQKLAEAPNEVLDGVVLSYSLEEEGPRLKSKALVINDVVPANVLRSLSHDYRDILFVSYPKGAVEHGYINGSPVYVYDITSTLID